MNQLDQLNVQQTWMHIQRFKKHAGTDTIEFIFHKYNTKYRRAAYLISACDIRPQKTETYRTRHISGVNLIEYPGEVITPT